MTDYDKIIAVASLMNKGDEEDDALQYAFDKLTDAEMALVIVAGKLLEGKRYGVITDDPEGEMTLDCRALVTHIGGSIELVTQDGDSTQIIFRPPAWQ
jgi:hypothetical protein